GQLLWRLQNDDPVKVRDPTHIRYFTLQDTDWACHVMVGALSFIFLNLTLPEMFALVKNGSIMLAMVKLQFEVGKERVGSSGVVRSPELRAEVTHEVATFAQSLGLSCHGVVASPLPGPSGNVEYFLKLVKDGGATHPREEELLSMIETAIKDGPQ